MIAEMLRSPFEPISTVSNRELKEIEPLYYETYQDKHDKPKRENDIYSRTVIDGRLGPIFAFDIRWHWNLPHLARVLATRM
jgi:hypothetical protein